MPLRPAKVLGPNVMTSFLLRTQIQMLRGCASGATSEAALESEIQSLFPFGIHALAENFGFLSFLQLGLRNG